MTYEYQTRGTCSSRILVDIDGDTINHVEFIGGCNGNTQGLSHLLEGASVKETISRLKGIRCGMRPTSCPDQLARALEQASAQQ